MQLLKKLFWAGPIPLLFPPLGPAAQYHHGKGGEDEPPGCQVDNDITVVCQAPQIPISGIVDGAGPNLPIQGDFLAPGQLIGDFTGNAHRHDIGGAILLCYSDNVVVPWEEQTLCIAQILPDFVGAAVQGITRAGQSCLSPAAWASE